MTLSGTPARARPASNYRWVICGLLFVITTINYMDRNILGVLKPTIQGDLHFTETDFGNIIFFFSIAYAIGYAGMGVSHRQGRHSPWPCRRRDPVVPGVHRTWHGYFRWPASSLARIVLGLGEGGNFPTCIKTVATWFPVRDRAFATGIFNSGSNIGAMLAPLIGALVVALSGWQAAFYVTGAIGLRLGRVLAGMLPDPAEHPRFTPSELAYIHQRPGGPSAEGSLGHAAALPRHLGLYRRRRADQSGLVVLQQLGAELSQFSNSMCRCSLWGCRWC